MKTNVVILLALSSISIFGQSDKEKTWLIETNLPDWFNAVQQTSIDKNKYEFSDYINPYYLEADFNGDDKLDIAVAIVDKVSHKKGIMVYHRDLNKYYILGAGQKIGNGGDDFNWMDIWKVYTKKVLQPGAGETKEITISYDALYVEKSESASGIIYWDGNNYKWFQQGD